MEAKESCGVVGIISSEPVAVKLFYSMRTLQHRGQESAGMAVFQDGVSCVKGMGLVHEIFKKDDLQKLGGRAGIGHIRYSTSGESALHNAQPVVVSTAYGDIALGHNGDIVNADVLRKELHQKGWAFITTSDSEIIVRLLANAISESGDVVGALKSVMRMLVGSYSLVILVNGEVYAVRDPYGVRPLCIGRLPKGFIACSESVAVEILDGTFLRDVAPGEIIRLGKTGIKSYRGAGSRNPAHCMFEWVYFSRPDSVLQGRNVFRVRGNIGEILAKECPVDADMVFPIPDSGRAFAIGYSTESGIQFREGLIKNRYVERTFIMPEQEEREASVMLKLNPLKYLVKGKRVIVVDDSIVRGTTMRKIVQMLKSSGAKKVHLRIGCPPIIAPCYFGIDMKTRDQFIAAEKNLKGIAKKLAADSVGYVSIDGLVKAIGLPRKSLCLGCLTGEYPMAVPGEKQREQRSLNGFAKY
jgi:amidophosphoribosyltransferase